MILRATHNFKISSGANFSIATEALVETEEEANEFGDRTRNLINAYIAGYSGKKTDEHND